MLKHVFIPTLVILSTSMQGCGQKQEMVDSPTSPSVPEESSPFDPMSLQLETRDLVEGRKIWIDTCADCHLEGLGGAPVIANKKDWKERINKGMETLYSHALEGFWGDVGEMPSKGGNEALTDKQVKLAVDFVIHASK
jgi:cytochrome c5